MIKPSDFVIKEEATGEYVVVGQGIYQDIDFEKGGSIKTKERAIELRDLLIESLNKPIENVKSPEEEIAQLKAQQILMQTAIDDLIMGGIM